MITKTSLKQAKSIEILEEKRTRRYLNCFI